MMFDLLIKGATFVDGTGAKAWVGDAAIAEGRLAALDRYIPAEARRVIDADGYIMAPGFIDIHCHFDFSLFDHPEADIKLRQGVTYDHPRCFPEGLLATIVNGEVVIDGGKHTGAKPGRFYRKGNLV